MSREREHTHPVFAQVYRLIAAAGERGGFGRLRESVLADARGRLLILGLGPGHDLNHLPAAVTSVVAVEPDPVMRALARTRIAACPVPVTLLSADAHALPLSDGSVDAALCACVLCSVAHPSTALAELRRVLVPEGRLLLLEHVAAPSGHWVERIQHALQPLWGRAAGGCRCGATPGAPSRPPASTSPQCAPRWSGRTCPPWLPLSWAPLSADEGLNGNASPQGGGPARRHEALLDVLAVEVAACGDSRPNAWRSPREQRPDVLNCRAAYDAVRAGSSGRAAPEAEDLPAGVREATGSGHPR